MTFWRRLLPQRTAKAPPALPPGRRLYAIGDMHGRADLLATLLDAIAADLDAAPCRDALIVGLGDYIDRGPRSAQTLDLLTGALPAPLIALRGNHEEMLLAFLEDATALDDWRRYGGLETLHSYGVDVRHAMQGRGFEAARDELRARMPAAHIAFLQATAHWYALGDYFFCHAGVRPGVALDRQEARDLLWIREDFLRSTASHGKTVVHGHTPAPAPEVRANRINLDTGAYASNALTCLRLEGAGQILLTASPDGVHRPTAAAQRI